MKVFFSGSKRIRDLGVTALESLDRTMAEGDEILIGDCHGADALIQKYLAESGYPYVTVYCSGDEPRFNAGEWETEKVVLDPALTHGYAFWRQKDIQMEFDCDRAVAVWDGKSRGTRQNMIELAALGKKCDVILKDEDGSGLLDGIQEVLSADLLRMRLRGTDDAHGRETVCDDAVTLMFLEEARRRNAAVTQIRDEKELDFRVRFEKNSVPESMCPDCGYSCLICWEEERKGTYRCWPDPD